MPENKKTEVKNGPPQVEENQAEKNKKQLIQLIMKQQEQSIKQSQLPLNKVVLDKKDCEAFEQIANTNPVSLNNSKFDSLESNRSI